jgi:hypothetical protein
MVHEAALVCDADHISQIGAPSGMLGRERSQGEASDFEVAQRSAKIASAERSRRGSAGPSMFARGEFA